MIFRGHLEADSCKHENVGLKHYNFTPCFVLMQNLVSYSKYRTVVEDVQEQDAERVF